MSTMTTLQLSIMMAAYTGCPHYIDHYPYSETYLNQLNILLKEGMIIENKNCDSVAYQFKLTDKGEFWYKYVLNLAWPVETKLWEIPKL